MKKRLNFKKGEIENIIKEEEVSTLKKLKGVKKENSKFNDGYYKEVAKKFEDYNEPLKDTEKENSDAVMKYTNSEENQEYHDEYEILNGLEMTIYGNDPGEKFRDRAEKAIAGDPTMGNDPEWANVVTADQAGFTGPEFGKNLIDRIKSRQKKSDAEAEKWNGMGDVAIPLGKPKKPNFAISENKKQVKMKRLNENVEYETKEIVGYGDQLKNETHFAIHKPTNSIVFTWDYNGYEPDELKYAKDDYFFNDVEDEAEAMVDKFRKGDFVIVTKKGLDKRGIDLNNYLRFQGQKYDKLNENKKTMKRLRFKKPFTGVENALRLIPESYKVDNKTFQMTDGNEKYEIRWEGNINEGRAIILKASDKVLMNEDMQKMKHLMQYNSKDTLGNLRGKERINENKVFNDVWDKTKSIKESAFGFGFTNEGNLEENEDLDENEGLDEN